MKEKEKKGTENRVEKPPYETPEIVPLGETIRGSGLCIPGSGDAGPCVAGNAARNCNTGSAG